jgi:hypothetical protein
VKVANIVNGFLVIFVINTLLLVHGLLFLLFFMVEYPLILPFLMKMDAAWEPHGMAIETKITIVMNPILRTD